MSSLRAVQRLSYVLIVLSTASARADDLYWDNAGSGLPAYSNLEFWSLDAALTMPAPAGPGAADDVFFDVDATYSVILGASSQAANLTFSNGDVSLLDVGGSTLTNDGTVTIDDAFAVDLAGGARATLTGTTATWDNVGDATVGDTGFGQLTINGGSDFISSSLYIGDQLNSVGEVNIDGAGSMLTSDAVGFELGIFIGNAGTGTMNITGGGVARTTDSSGAADWELGVTADGHGTLNIDGGTAFGEDVVIGVAGTGHLNITGGGVFNQNLGSTPDAFLGLSAGSSGEVIVSGAGSQWLMRRLDVGQSSSGTLAIEAGALVRTTATTVAGDFTVGNFSGSDGKVAVYGSDIAPSLLDVDDSLYVGRTGFGQLNVGRDLDDNEVGTGSLQVDANLIIGDEVDNTADNRLVISGASATANVGNLIRVGNEGRGTMEILGGATVTSGLGRIGEFGFAGAEGTVTVDGANSSWDMTGDLYVGVQGGTGTLNVTGGAFVGNDDDLVIGHTSGSRGTVLVSGAGSQLAPVDINNAAADVIIGNSGVGQVTVADGGFLFVETEVYMALGSPGSGRLTVQGTDSLVTIGENPQSAANEIFVVGSAGRARVEILDGGEIQNERTVINHIAPDAAVFGEAFNETFLVSGVDENDTPSLLRTFGRMEVGATRQASLRIAGGGQVISNDGIARGGAGDSFTLIGNTATADNSSVVITDAGSKWFDAYDPDGEVQDDNPFIIGNSASGVTFDIENGGALQTGQAFIARLAGSSADVSVTGAGSRWDASSLIVGNRDRGTLTVSDAGTVVSAGLIEVGNDTTGNGTLTVTGSGSNTSGTSYSVGDTNGAVGVVNISLGGTATATVSFNLGEVSGGNGTANIGTANAADPIATLQVANNVNVGGNDGGDGGIGVLNVHPSGLVNIQSTLAVFDQGTVNLMGGTISTSALDVAQVGDFNFAAGTLRFTGSKTFDTPALAEIFAGDAAPTLTANRHLAVASTAVVSSPLRLNGGIFSVGSISPASVSNLDFDAGTFNLTGSDLTVGTGGQFGASIVLDSDETIHVLGHTATIDASGSLNVIEGAFTSAATINNGLVIVSGTTAVDFDSDDSGSGLTNNGTLVAIDSTIAGTVDNNGDIEIVGTVNFTDGLSLLAAGSLGIDVASLTTFDQIAIAGDATLAGTLALEFGDLTLSPGTSIEILDVAGVLSGTFDGLADGTVVGNFSGLDLLIDYQGGDGNDVVLRTVAAPLPGDFNNDGRVDLADYTVWRDNLGAASESPINNNGDGLAGVDAADYAVWKTSFGNPAAAQLTNATAAVPEPGTLCLLLALAAAASLPAARRHCRPA